VLPTAVPTATPEPTAQPEKVVRLSVMDGCLVFVANYGNLSDIDREVILGNEKFSVLELTFHDGKAMLPLSELNGTTAFHYAPLGEVTLEGGISSLGLGWFGLNQTKVFLPFLVR